MDSAENIMSHKVFPMTYLRKVVFSISYGKLAKECYSSLMEFIKGTFGFEVTEELLDNLSNRPLYFGTDDHTLEWCISDVSLDILILQEAYTSFKESLQPLVEIAGEFLKNADCEAEEITLRKINLIPVSLSSYDDLKENAVQIFTESILSGWNGDVYQKSDDALVYLSKNKGDNGVDLEVITGFLSKGGVAEDQPSRYILDITARYAGEVASDEVLECVTSMNDQIYNAFIGAVEEDIIKSMEDA